MNYMKDEPVFFKKKPRTEDTKPNATFVRDLGILNGDPICEIHYGQEKWKCKHSEALPIEVALKQLAEHWNNLIESAKKGGAKTKGEVAKALRISQGTLSARYKLIRNHLVKP